MKKKVERDRAAQYFREIAGPNGHFAHQPVGPARPLRIPVAATLSKILARDHAQTGGNDLHEDGDEASEANHPQQSVLILRAGLKIRAPIARVHVPDTYKNGRTHESPPLLPEARLVMGDLDGAVHSLQGDTGISGRGFAGSRRPGTDRAISSYRSVRLTHDRFQGHPGSTGVHDLALTIVNYTERDSKRETQILSAADLPRVRVPAAVLIESVLS